MKLYIREKLVSLHNRYYIYNESGEQVYELISKYFSVGNKTKLIDMEGNELIYVEQELFHLRPVYLIYMDGDLVATVKKKTFIGLPIYEVPELNYKIEGNFTSTEFNIVDSNDDLVAVANRKFISIGDKYHIEIFDDKNHLYILGILIAIINVVDDGQQSTFN